MLSALPGAESAPHEPSPGRYPVTASPLPALQSDLPLAAQEEVAAARLLAKTGIKKRQTLCAKGFLVVVIRRDLTLLLRRNLLQFVTSNLAIEC